MKKLGQIVCLFAVLGMILTACGTAATPTPAPVPTTAPATAAPTTAATAAPTVAPTAVVPNATIKADCAGKTINFLTIQPHQVAAQNLQTWFEAISGATVNLTVVGYDVVTEKAVLDVTSGADQVDVVEYWYPGLGEMVQDGVLENLDKWYSDNASWLNTADYYQDYFDAFTKIGNSRYGIPYDGDLHLLWYYKPLLAKYNLQPPTTWDEYLNVEKTITQGEHGAAYGSAIMGQKVPLIIIGTFLSRLGAYGGTFFDKNGNPVVDSPEAVAALTALVEETKYSLPTATATGFNEAIAGWLTKKVAMMEFWTDLGAMSDDPKSSQVGGDYGVEAMPAGPGPNGVSIAPVNAGFGMGVSTGSQNKACAYQFLAFVARPDTSVKYNTVVGGIDPVRQSTLNDPTYQNFIHPEIAAAVKAAHAHAVFWPTSAVWSQMEEPLTDNLALALTGDKTPQQALDDTQLAWLQLVKK